MIGLIGQNQQSLNITQRNGVPLPKFPDLINWGSHR